MRIAVSHLPVLARIAGLPWRSTLPSWVQTSVCLTFWSIYAQKDSLSWSLKIDLARERKRATFESKKRQKEGGDTKNQGKWRREKEVKKIDFVCWDLSCDKSVKKRCIIYRANEVDLEEIHSLTALSFFGILI